ncbi:ferritin, partial [Francisella tularensis subsp. holarctica]|uniref:ferritin n=1 Tax=Francisella tularensis TaxID=263 RepID=UPI002381A5B7
ANIYFAMAVYTSDLGLGGFSNLFMAQYEEELFHEKKIMKFISDKNGRIEVKSVAAPQNNVNSLLEVFQATLVHEQEVSTRFYD